MRGTSMAKKGPRYVDWYVDKERNKGKRFTEEQVKSLSQNYEGIYLHSDGKRFVAVANIAFVDKEGNTKYARPEKIHETVSDAKRWLESERSKGRCDFEKGIVQNPTLSHVIALTNAYKQTLSGWRNFRNYRAVILDYFGGDKKLLSITEEDYLAFQSWLLKQVCITGYTKGKKLSSPQGKTLSPSTVNYYCRELAWLFKYAKRKGMISIDRSFSLLKKSGHRPFNIDLSDFLSCIAHVPRHEAMLLLALNTGGRKCDVANMTEDRLSTRLVREVGSQGKEVFVKRTFITMKSSKTSKDNLNIPMLSELESLIEREREVRDTMLARWFERLTDEQHPEHRETVRKYERILGILAKRRKQKALAKAAYLLPIPELPLVKDLSSPQDLNPERFLFLNPTNLLPYKSIQFALNTAIKKSGIKHFTMHVIRHLATTLLLDITGGDVDLVQRIIGWSNKTMIQVYGHIGHRAIDTFERFDSLLEKSRGDKHTPKPTHIRLLKDLNDVGDEEREAGREGEKNVRGKMGERVRKM